MTRMKHRVLVVSLTAWCLLWTSQLAIAGIDLSTFLGGNALDGNPQVALDAEGNIFIVGETSSADFPTTPGAFDPTFNGSGDIFVTKLSADGSSLLFSTFVGGSGFDTPAAIVLDANGNVLIAGNTRSPRFPTTPDVFDLTFNEGNDVFVMKLSADGSRVLFSTFVGDVGEGGGAVRGIALDQDGQPVITGETFAPDFPTTTGAFDTMFNSVETFASDIFVTTLAVDASRLLFSTFAAAAVYVNA